MSLTQPSENINTILSKLDKVKRSGDGWIACCPSHNDKHQSLKVSVGNDGQILLHCFAGCTVEQICSALGIAVKDLFPTQFPTKEEKHVLTIEELAQAKAIPVDFLKSLGLREDGRGVIIPYLDQDGKSQRQRKRTHVVARQGSLWEGQGKIIPYGLWKLEEARKAGYLVLVEGESDSWTLWNHGYPVLGIPSADMTKTLEAKHLDGIATLYVVNEKDKGAEVFLAGIKARLEEFKWQGKACIITMPEGSKDPNDLHRQNPQAFKDTFKKILDNASNPTPTVVSEPEKAQPTVVSEPERPAFPINAFPQAISQYCQELSESMVVPIEYPACAILTEAGALIGAKKGIEIKTDWHERSVIFSAIVGSPGSGKSPATMKTMSVIWEIEEELSKQNKREEEKYEGALLDYENALAQWKAQAKKGVNPEKPQKPEKPNPQTLVTNDSTVEAVAEILGNNERGILIYRDELTAWISSLNQYKGGKGSDREFFLSAWSGAPAKVDRKGKKPIYIPKPFLCVVGGIVPDSLNVLRANVHDGFIDRILFSFPEPIRHLWSDQSVSPDIKETVKALLKSLYQDNTPEVITLTETARENFASNYDSFNDGQGSNTQGVRAKLPAYTARFALILTLLHKKKVCDWEVMEKAIDLAKYFQSQAEKVFAELETSKEQKETNAILDWAKRKGLKRIKVRDFYINHVPGCTSASVAKMKLQELVEIGLAKWVSAREIEFDA